MPMRTDRSRLVAHRDSLPAMSGTFEARYTDWRRISYQPAIAEHAPEDLLPLLPASARVLEIGCNDGSVGLRLAKAGYHVLGVDLNEEAIEVARQKARELRLEHVAQFLAADALQEELGTHDATLLIRALTCFPDEDDWVKLLDSAWATVVPDGLLYVHDFRKDAESPVYRPRYEDGAARGWRDGNFLVWDRDGAPLFVAHHHNDHDIQRIQAARETVVLREHPSLSMNGNPCRMFVYIGRKPRPANSEEDG